MAQTDQIKQLVSRLGSDPTLINELSTARNPQQAKQVLVNRGIISAGDSPPARAEISQEMIQLMQAQLAAPPVPGERPVEWVGAVGQLAGAAAAGFCAS